MHNSEANVVPEAGPGSLVGLVSGDLKNTWTDIIKFILEHGIDATVAKFSLEALRDLFIKTAGPPDVPTQWSPDEKFRSCSTVEEVKGAVLVRFAHQPLHIPVLIFVGISPSLCLSCAFFFLLPTATGGTQGQKSGSSGRSSTFRTRRSVDQGLHK